MIAISVSLGTFFITVHCQLYFMIYFFYNATTANKDKPLLLLISAACSIIRASRKFYVHVLNVCLL